VEKKRPERKSTATEEEREKKDLTQKEKKEGGENIRVVFSV